MSEQNAAFEKWAETNNLRYQLQKDENGTYLSPNTYFHFMGWQAATAEAEKRRAELEIKIAVAELKHDRNEWYKDAQDKRLRILELQAHINALREALHLVNEHSKLWGFKIAGNVQTEIDAALSATPAESLQAFENDVLERAAKVCDEKCLQLEKKAGEYLEDGEWDEVNNQRAIAWIVSVVATSIRALKGK